jgi:hypothetical protein
MIMTGGGPMLIKLRRAALMLIPAAVLMAFATYLYVLTGSWTACIAPSRPVGYAS